MAAPFSSHHLSLSGRVIGLLVCIAGTITACGAPADRARIEPTYNRTTGRLELLKYDANGDGNVDT